MKIHVLRDLYLDHKLKRKCNTNSNHTKFKPTEKLSVIDMDLDFENCVVIYHLQVIVETVIILDRNKDK